MACTQPSDHDLHCVTVSVSFLVLHLVHANLILLQRMGQGWEPAIWSLIAMRATYLLSTSFEAALTSQPRWCLTFFRRASVEICLP